jgi:hypothetical protein
MCVKYLFIDGSIEVTFNVSFYIRRLFCSFEILVHCYISKFGVKQMLDSFDEC